MANLKLVIEVEGGPEQVFILRFRYIRYTTGQVQAHSLIATVGVQGIMRIIS